MGRVFVVVRRVYFISFVVNLIIVRERENEMVNFRRRVL